MKLATKDKNTLKNSYMLLWGLILSIVLVLFFIIKNNDKKLPFITVLITSYNYGEYLPETLNSVLSQTYKNYEIVVIDDGSEDNSVEIIKGYAEKHKNIKLFTHKDGKNNGLVASLILGISKSKGEFVAFLESDDYWHKDNLLEKIKILEKHPKAKIIGNRVEPFGDAARVKMQKPYLKSIDDKIYSINYFREYQANPIPTMSSVMIQRNVLNNLDFNVDSEVNIDFHLYKQVFVFHPLYYINKTLTYWRQHNRSFSYIESFK
ncbi:MAG: glycosyltransferase family 2 protein [Alphaproteobacteria bacterium]|nr:glycosyltransferase family 2 protein [Alphaproteobacteria bacterium]